MRFRDKKCGSGMGKIRIRNTVFFVIKVRILDQVWESYRAADGAWAVPPAGARPPGAATHRQQQQHQARVTQLLGHNVLCSFFIGCVWSIKYSFALSGRHFYKTCFSKFWAVSCESTSFCCRITSSCENHCNLLGRYQLYQSCLLLAIKLPHSTPFSEGFWKTHCLKWILLWSTICSTSQQSWLEHFFLFQNPDKKRKIYCKSSRLIEHKYLNPDSTHFETVFYFFIIKNFFAWLEGVWLLSSVAHLLILIRKALKGLSHEIDKTNFDK